MRRFLSVAGAKWAAWRRRHPWLFAAALLLLAALLGWAGYRAHGYVEARSHFRAAQQALGRQEWSEARGHLDECLRSWPDSPAVHLLAARALRRLGLPDEAEEHLDGCRRHSAGETQPVRVERALLQVSRGDLAGAEDFLRACVARDDPDSVEILDVLSLALILDDRVPEAHQCLEDALRRQPDNFPLLARRAQTAQRQGWYSVAADSLQKALEVRPEAHDLRLSLAQNLIQLGRYPDAREHLARLREEEPDNPAVLFALARCLALQGHKDRAVRLLDRLLAREPSNWTTLAERGWLSLERDRPAEAETFLRRAHSLAPPDQTLLTRLADCLRLLGKHEEARRYRKEADDLRADTLRALGLRRQIREDRAGNADRCHDLACVLLRLGKRRDALRYFHKALKADPSHRPTHESLAAFYAQAGAFGQAASHRRQRGRHD
jgi:tetratricopeptide (TPR) repeat protein